MCDSQATRRLMFTGMTIDFSFSGSDVSVLWCGANVILYFLKSKYFFNFVTIPDLTTVWKYCILYADSIKPR